MTAYADTPHPQRQHGKPIKQEVLFELLTEVKGLLLKHYYGTPDHLTVIAAATSKLQTLQTQGVVTSYEMKEVVENTIHLQVFMPRELYVGGERSRVRRELRGIARKHGLEIDARLLPDGCHDGQQD